jgi:hypothetical protein
MGDACARFRRLGLPATQGRFEELRGAGTEPGCPTR